MNTNPTLRIGLTLGDVNGVGPEVVLKAVYRGRWPAGWRFALIGPSEILREQARRYCLPTPPTAIAPGEWPPGPRTIVWEAGAEPQLRWRPGHVSAAAARASVAALRAATDAARADRLDAIVTAPIHKGAWGRAGIQSPGHTELLAQWCGVRSFAMMLVGGPLRVVLATRHLPLRLVAGAVTRPAVRCAIEQAKIGLDWLGCCTARIAVCGLNPHAGDSGRLGDEERRIIAPEVMAARRRGWDLSGPIPADTAFHLALQRRYDLVVAMYHDQGLAPLKMIAFEMGVNVTLGLPFVRTSPDHGTAFDIAGRGTANPRSLRAAIRLAGKLAGRPNPWRTS